MAHILASSNLGKEKKSKQNFLEYCTAIFLRHDRFTLGNPWNHQGVDIFSCCEALDSIWLIFLKCDIYILLKTVISLDVAVIGHIILKIQQQILEIQWTTEWGVECQYRECVGIVASE